MTLHITNTKDFSDKLKQLIEAHTTLKDAGIDPEDPIFDDSITGFLDQFDTPEPFRPTVPLPPADLTTKHPTAWVAQSKTSGGTVAGTATTYSVDAEALLKQKVLPMYRHEYEIVPLYIND